MKIDCAIVECDYTDKLPACMPEWHAANRGHLNHLPKGDLAVILKV